MPIYHVDTFNGNDANNGSNWANAWKSTFPLKALYAGVTSVQDLEVRFAKTAATESARGITFGSTGNGTHAYCAGIARPMAGYRKPVIPDYWGSQTYWLAWQATIISPFSTPGEGINPPYRPAGTYKLYVTAPAGSNGRALKWLVSDGNFASFDCIEVVGAWEQAGATASLELCSDADGTTVVRTYSLPFGTQSSRARLALIGQGDLPNGIASVFLKINNPTAFQIGLDMSTATAVLPATHPNYVGLRQIYVPNDKLGNALTMAATDGTYTMFNGQDSSNIDGYRLTQGEAARTWTVYPWAAYPYEVEPVLASASVVGSPATPVKISGGWNTTTNLRDGITAIDAGHLRWFDYVARVSVDVRHLAIAFRRTAFRSDNLSGGIMEERRLADQRINDCYAERVYIPMAGAGVVGTAIGFYNSSWRDDCLVGTVESNNDFESSRASMKDCNSVGGPPFFGTYGTTLVQGCTFGQTIPFVPAMTLMEDCVFLGTRTYLSVIGGSPHPPYKFLNCDVVAPFVSDSWGNDYGCSPHGWHENCRWWGAHTGPRNPTIQAKNCTWRPLPGAIGPICSSGCDIDGLAAPINEPSLVSTTSMFARGGIAIEPVTIRLKNSNVQVLFASITPGANATDRRGHTVTLDNVTFNKTSAGAGVAFLSARIKAKNITLNGAWQSLFSGIIRGGDIDGMVMTDATTRIVNDYSFSGPATGHGRVASYFRNVLHPLGLEGSLGTPVARYASGAGYFQSTTGELWATDVMKVVKDTSVSHRGMSSWKATATLNIGAASRGSYMLGALPVVAGVALTFKAWIRRDSYDVLGGIFLRPLGTREHSAPGALTGETFHDIVAMQAVTQVPGSWAEVTISYTPFASGLVELHFGMRGVTGNSVWLDTIKVTQ